ncbi:SDR family oxidoreductase [Lichenicoccus sp.]|uniref:SDR family oxidoreductase n=1 Tax=Lichenicoccus sp. TaxID=2781899 RepID=UPI003D0A2700
MGKLSGKVAWVTGAGSGIGQAAATALAGAGARIVLTGRRVEPLQVVADGIASSGGEAIVEPGDLTVSQTVSAIADRIGERFGRLDILVNNAGLNTRLRRWDQLVPEAIDTVLAANLSAAFYCTAAALKLMRARRDGVLIHTASWAGKFIHPVSGPAYTAAKHAVVAMSQSLNMEEYGNGIRSTALLPAEVATPILDTRPVPPDQQERARMLQPDDLGDLILYIATRPASVCLNEIVISPTWNRMYQL